MVYSINGNALNVDGNAAVTSPRPTQVGTVSWDNYFSDVTTLKSFEKSASIYMGHAVTKERLIDVIGWLLVLCSALIRSDGSIGGLIRWRDVI